MDINRLKAKTVRLHRTRLVRHNIELQYPDALQEERSTLYHLIKRRQRRMQRTITAVDDPTSGITTTTPRGIITAFSTYLRLKYSPIQVDDESIQQLAEAGLPRLSENWRNALNGPLTLEELKAAIMKGDGNKAPGRDGIGYALFKANWDVVKDDWLDILSTMFARNNISEQQKRGVIVCIPKTARPHQPSDYRPITLLNTDCKILARVVANRLRPTLEDLLHPNQYCGRPGNTIFEALATVRDAIAFAETTRTPLCIISLDFIEAFDRMSHKYLFAILRCYGFSDTFVEHIQHMYDNATSMVQVNGHLSAPSPFSAPYDRAVY